MTSSQFSVACIGLGRMGAGIAQNIQSTGWRLTVYNRSAEKAQPFVAAGATLAKTPKEAAAAADVVVTSLMDDQSVLATVTGPDGILAGMRPGGVHIGTTTNSPVLGARLATLHEAQGSHYVAAPVIGRPDAAAAKRLIAFVAGKADAIERARPVLESYTARTIVLGEEPAMANNMKLVANFFISGLLELIGEAFAFADKTGVLAAYSELLKGFLPLGEYVDRICNGDFERPGFTLDAGLKDVRLILEAAAEAQVPLPYASLVRDKCLAAQAYGWNDLDWCVFTEIARLNAGQTRRRVQSAKRS